MAQIPWPLSRGAFAFHGIGSFAEFTLCEEMHAPVSVYGFWSPTVLAYRRLVPKCVYSAYRLLVFFRKQRIIIVAAGCPKFHHAAGRAIRVCGRDRNVYRHRVRLIADQLPIDAGHDGHQRSDRRELHHTRSHTVR